MPALVSLPILDANGDGILDGTSIPIGEAETDVVILGGAFVALLFAPELTVALLLDVVGTAILDILAAHQGGGVIPQTTLDKIDDIDEIIQTWKTATGTDHLKLEVMRGQLDDIHAAYPPSWPSGTPSWYTPPSSGGTAKEIWDYAPTYAIPNTMGSYLQGVGVEAIQASYWKAIPIAKAPGFAIWGYWGAGTGAPVGDLPIPDWSDILDTDTRLSWLQRTDAANTWTQASEAPNPSAPWGYDGELVRFWVYPTFTEADFQAWKLSGLTSGQIAAVKADTETIIADIAALTPGSTSPSSGAPVWPGLDAVTLGTPVALVNNLALEGPMDGVLVEVTTPPSSGTLYQIGGKLYDYGVGDVAFESDNGDVETRQYLGFRTAIYTPHTMKQAARALFRVLRGEEGTVTPWTVNPST